MMSRTLSCIILRKNLLRNGFVPLQKTVRMAGGGDGESALDYEYDESKYKGFWKYYNSETPNGRAGAGAMALTFLVSFILYLKFRKSSPSEAVEAGTK